MKPPWLHSPTGRLDARLHGATGRPVLVLHPHPKYGGSMATRFVYAVCVALAEAGFQAVRFDMRGVGRSAGAYDGGRGESDDALAVWDALRAATGMDPAVVGFSFGAGVAVRLAGQRQVPAMVLVAPPARVRDSELDLLADAAAAEGTPTHVVIGTADALVPAADAERVRAALHGTITALQGADHFLTPEYQGRGVVAVVQALDSLLAD